MVLSLFDACRVGIRNALENGIPLPVHKLPLHFRQPILDMVLMHGTINEPACLAVLSSTEFLNGSSSLNVLCGEVNDCNFLDRVATSLATIAPNVGTLGSNMLELHLNLYHDSNRKATNLASVVRLIAECPRLVRLEFRMKLHACEDEVETDENDVSDEENILANILRLDGKGPSFLNDSQVWNPCLSVLENLEELAVIGSFLGFFTPRPKILNSGYSALKFKKLMSLNLDFFMADADAYRQLLCDVGETLTTLRAVNCGTANNRLPIPLPSLKSLDLGWFFNDKEFISNLKDCPELEHVYLGAHARIGDACLVQLAGMNAQLKISLDLDGLVSIMSEKIQRFANLLGENVICLKLGERCTFSLQHLIDKSQNLESLTTRFGSVIAQYREAIFSLVPLFTNKERALKLRKLDLHGGFDESLLESISMNCVNLDHLKIGTCPQFGDRHLIELAGRGARLSVLELRYCHNITDDGIIPILKSSGDKLVSFDADGSPRITDFAYRAAFEFCHYVEWESFRNQELKNLAILKSFIKVNHLPLDVDSDDD